MLSAVLSVNESLNVVKMSQTKQSRASGLNRVTLHGEESFPRCNL